MINIFKKNNDAFMDINGVKYSGKNITIKNNKVIVDGKDVTPDGKEINIKILSHIDKIDVDQCNKIEVTGNVGSIQTTSGDVSVTGDIKGNLKTMSGDIKIKGSITGNVNTMSGDVECDNIGGNVETVSGDIN